MEPIQERDPQAFLIKHDSVARAGDCRDEGCPLWIDLHELRVRQLNEEPFKTGKRFGSRVTFSKVLEQALQIGNHPFEIPHASRIELAVLRCQRSAADREVGHGEQGQSKLFIALHALRRCPSP